MQIGIRIPTPDSTSSDYMEFILDPLQERDFKIIQKDGSCKCESRYILIEEHNSVRTVVVPSPMVVIDERRPVTIYLKNDTKDDKKRLEQFYRDYIGHKLIWPDFANEGQEAVFRIIS